MLARNNPGRFAIVADLYFRFLKLIIAFCLLAMVILVFGNVVLRYLFNSGISVSEELSRWFFIWLTFTGALVGLREHAHLGMDLFVKRLSSTGRRVCLILSQLLMLYASCVLLQGSWSQTLINLEVEAPASGFSMAFVYGTGVFFAANALLIIFADLWRTLFRKRVPDEWVMIRESEERIPEMASEDDGKPEDSKTRGLHG